MGVIQKLCISKPEMAKPKCVWEMYIGLHFCQMFVYNFLNQWTPSKHI